MIELLVVADTGIFTRLTWHRMVHEDRLLNGSHCSLLRRAAATALCAGALLCVAYVAGAQAQAAAPAATVMTIQVGGAVRTPGAWTVARIDNDLAGDIQSITYKVKDAAHTARAVPLLSLVNAAAPSVNPRIKNHALQFVVAVQGFDGYSVDFSIGELSPDFGNNAAWVLVEEDGKPLGPQDGIDLVVPGDVKHGRWVHEITGITLVDTATMP
jgi:hypothetical protein